MRNKNSKGVKCSLENIMTGNADVRPILCVLIKTSVDLLSSLQFEAPYFFDTYLCEREMAIVYAVVARGTTVLAEFSAVTGNTGAVARRILEKLPNETESRLCFSQDRYIFHILRSNGITFLCMANETFGSEYKFRLCCRFCVKFPFFVNQFISPAVKLI